MNEKIDKLQDDVKENATRVWLAGVGALAMAGEEGSKLFNSLVERGQSYEKKDDKPTDGVKNAMGSMRDQVDEIWSKVEGSFNERVAKALEKLGVPTRDEINDLSKRVDKLTEAINKLSEQDTKKSTKSSTSSTKKS